MSKTNIIIYRMTHIENIPHILENGITHKNSLNSNPHYRNIGDLSLIDNRSQKEVSVDNGNYLNLNPKKITLGNFIPFYFGIRMPMLYTAQIGGNFVENATSPESIIYLACSVDSIIGFGHEYYFSDGHATNNYSSFYDSSKIADINNILDWSAIKSNYWGGNENLNTKRKKQAEFLILGDINIDNIVGFGCYNEDAKNKLIQYGVKDLQIKVIPNGYF
ncbi:type II toxin-antitoxin system toxin DNA ADP-ribosyl transferase DarT [Empedobacter falsenii]|uniref:DUF4433 domain-containing protein n=1 Tax=Empedobacter falsenii TaxID=343874 RepID=A0ABY8V9J4_9FLAO|nr:DUF4433 domain-containing protein [Empedobacter falsenii]WIH98354.1 DUF4433 domain-containing protein [Empedobacter falsenii]